jgi:hypothetical protein
VDGTEASSNGGVRGAFSLMRGLVDRHVPSTLLHRGVLAGVGPVSLRNQALCLLSCRVLKEHAQLVVGATCLRHRRFRDSLEQSRYGSDILTRSGKEWGSFGLHCGRASSSSFCCSSCTGGGVGLFPGLHSWSRTGECLSGIDPLGTARKLPVRKRKSDSY